MKEFFRSEKGGEKRGNKGKGREKREREEGAPSTLFAPPREITCAKDMEEGGG